MKKEDYVIQSVIFNKKEYNKPESEMWLIHHNFNTKFINKKESPRETSHFLRWRQKDPTKFYPDTFRTKEISPYIKLIVGIKRK